jgi:hypothetical protein
MYIRPDKPEVCEAEKRCDNLSCTRAKICKQTKFASIFLFFSLKFQETLR